MYFDNSGLAVVAPPSDDTRIVGIEGIETEYVQTHFILADGGDRFGVSALTFDKHEDLLWMGNQGGHVTSYLAPAMSKYTSFQVHSTEDVRQILTIDEGILVLTASTLRYQMRRGIPLYTHTFSSSSSNMNEMQCILQMSPSRFLIGGHQDKLIDFNLTSCKETTVTSVGAADCLMLRPHSRYVCAGSSLGRIDLRDPNSLKIEHSIETHTGSLSDFDVQHNLLVTCGFSNRHNSLAMDRFLMVYDLRMLRAVSPMQTVIDPFFLKFIPSISSRLALVSAMGQIQLLDTIALAEPKLCLFQMENPGAMCLTFDISSSCQTMACGDNSGHIHIFSNVTSGPVINTYSRPSELPDTPTGYPSFGIDDYSTPLSVIPMPIVAADIPLASNWPAGLVQKVYRRPFGIDPEILRTMKMQGPIGYAPNPKTTRRNQVAYNFGQNGTMGSHINSNRSPKHHEENSTFLAIPKRYRKIDVKYNKLGNDDLHFDQYNKTALSGLEAILPNSYCNSMIQVLYYTAPLRSVLLSHLCSKEFCLSCELGFLFHMLYNSSQNQPCQPGNFLRAFRTVPEASALGLILSDLLPEAKQKIDLAALIQSWNRFILHQMHVELAETKKKAKERRIIRKPFVYKETDFPNITNQKIKDKKIVAEFDVDKKLESEKWEEESDIGSLFGSRQLQKSTCLKCSTEVGKESVLLSCNLVYPNSEPEKEEWSFCDILKRSLCPRQTTPAWCENCSKFSPTAQHKLLLSLPSVLAINTGLHHAQHKQFWQSQMDKIVAKAQSVELKSLSTPSTPISSSKPCRYGDQCSRPGCRFRHSFDNASAIITPSNPYCSNNWLPHDIELLLSGEELEVKALKNLKNEEETVQEGIITRQKYGLSAVVCYINDQASADKRNLIALLKVPVSYLEERNKNSNAESRWYLFNDFNISPVPAHEAVWFSLDWKVPCLLYYSSEEVLNKKFEVKLQLTRDVFTEDACIARSSTPAAGITFTPLYDHEFLKSGDLVAMDAEFVTLNQEESELRSDGKMSTVKPSQMSVARITCIRGNGHMEGTPFIDDYISTQEQVVDYLTKFSGIKPGDLDANFSSKHLTTLKSTYTKLRFLQDSGVIFVGHGLKNDFRVINLVVPPEQVVDTVQLFHLPHHRMVSLRFLAWHFLGIKIQSETHDSIEDARAALQLYKKYKQLEEQNKVGDALAELYEVGKFLNWKVPDE